MMQTERLQKIRKNMSEWGHANHQDHSGLLVEKTDGLKINMLWIYSGVWIFVWDKNTLNSEIKRNSAFAWRIWSRSPGKEISNSWCVLLSHSIFGTFFLASGEKGDLNGDGIGSAALWFFRKRAQRGKSKPPAYPNLFLLWRSTEELPSMQKTFIGHSRQVNKPCGPNSWPYIT